MSIGGSMGKMRKISNGGMRRLLIFEERILVTRSGLSFEKKHSTY